MTNPGAQWTARPTYSLRLSVSAGKRSRARKGADGRIPTQEAGSARTHTGAQWTARPTDSLRLWVDWSAAILAAVPTR